jgi:hypothetical protein
LTGIALQNSNGHGLDFDWNSYEIIFSDFEMNSLDPEILEWFLKFEAVNGTLERILKTLERISLRMEKFWMVEWHPGMSLFCRFLNFWIWFEKGNL